jgi:hypothetical protein
MLKVSEPGNTVKLQRATGEVMVSVTPTAVVSDPSAITTRELYLPAFSPFPDTATEKACEVWGANDCLPGLTLVQVAEDGDTDALTICVVVQ